MNEGDRPALHVAIFYWCVLLIEVVSFRFCWLEERIFVRIARFQGRRTALAGAHAKNAESAKQPRHEQKRPLRTL